MSPSDSLDARSLALIGLVLVGLVGSQLCVRRGLDRAGGVSLTAERGVQTVARLLKEPWLWAGVGLTGMAAVVWFEVLSRVSLSVAYPMLGLSYVLMLVMARWLFHEAVT